MDAFDRILNRTPEAAKRTIDKNLAIANRIIEILRGVASFWSWLSDY